MPVSSAVPGASASQESPCQARTAVAEVGVSAHVVQRAAVEAVPSQFEHEFLQPGVVPDQQQRPDLVRDFVQGRKQLRYPGAVQPPLEPYGRGVPHCRDANSQVWRARTAVEHRARSRYTVPTGEGASGGRASRRPRGARGRSWSATPVGHADFACRRTTSLRSGPAPARAITAAPRCHA